MLLLIVNGPRVLHLVLTPLVELALLRARVRGRVRALAAADVARSAAPARDAGPDLAGDSDPGDHLLLPAVHDELSVGVRVHARAVRTVSPRSSRAMRPRRGGGSRRHARARLVRGHGQRAHGPDRDGRDARASACGRGARAGCARGWSRARVGLYIGYPMLFFAPGQALRYAGMATEELAGAPAARARPRRQRGDRARLPRRGADRDRSSWSSRCSSPRAVARAAALPRARLLAIVALIASGGAMVVTLFASPTVGERLFFAPAVLFVGALVARRRMAVRGARAAPVPRRRVRRRVRVSRVSIRHGLRRAHAENQQRLASSRARSPTPSRPCRRTGLETHALVVGR